MTLIRLEALLSGVFSFRSLEPPRKFNLDHLQRNTRIFSECMTLVMKRWRRLDLRKLNSNSVARIVLLKRLGFNPVGFFDAGGLAWLLVKRSKQSLREMLEP